MYATHNPSNRRPRRLHLLVSIALLTFVAILSGCTSVEQLVSGPTITPPPPSGTRVEPPKELADFTLTDQHGEALNLSDLQGKPTLVFFGYTHCPDVCPLTLAEFSRVSAELGDRATDVNFVFVSVDWRRDTPARLNEYLPAFGFDVLGLTAESDEQIKVATETFGVYYELEQVPDTQAEYLVAHSSSSFLLNPEGEMAVIFAYRTAPEIIAADIVAMLEAQQ